MTGLREAIRYHAAALDATRPQPRFAVVESVDPARHLAKVTIQPEGVLTGWLPILGMGGGGAWGLICPPAIGAQVVVVPLDGDHESWAVLGAAWSTASVPPDPSETPGGGAGPVQPGEMALVSGAGAYVRLNADGTLTIVASAGITIKGNTEIEGTLTVTNDATIDGRGFMAHEHSGVQPGGGITGGVV
jgi:phage baseplate assembly protein gpV